ncbi:phospholipid carrier-dependent glycosyltransferase [Rhodovarius crocodyli]|uniref:Phospholipid carrier-dependent glycosyltransferase n=1 Tax=Rhodovarius crocodyli TaxID=1979269 RepID=A0A437M2H1_9PROT|nr:glycosyltransferase family 39 protein [Rhodovarius crocodyli]RVT91786.1 phospholipid carrier-dependent glycosyltransferase [Rhodovarius crocodyli]
MQLSDTFARGEALATRRPRLALILLCLCLYLPGFFTIPALDRDEARFAQASRQMLDSGDYVRMRVGEEDRNKKPVGIHWAQTAAVHALEAVGVPEARRQIWAYRIPSMLGAILAVLATFQLGRALVGRRAALLAGALLAGCMVLVVETHIAKTDAALLATVAAAMGLFGMAYLRPGAFTARQAAGFWAVLGVSILLKGPIGPMVPLLTGITLAVMDRGAPWLRALRLAWGIPLMIAIAAPWMVAIGIATEGRFFAEAVGNDMIAKVGSGEEKHWGPPGFYILTFIIAAFPTAWLAMPALRHAWLQRSLPATRFLLAWLVPSWLLFEAVQTKLPHYTLPLFPALMLLIAHWALDPLRLAPPRWMLWAMRALLVGVALGLGIVAPVAGYLMGGYVVRTSLFALPAGLLLAWAVLAATRNGNWARGAVLGVVLAVPVYVSVLELTLPRIEAMWISPRLGDTLERVAPGLPARDFGMLGHAEPSVLFRVGAEVRLLPDAAAAVDFLTDGRVVAVAHRQEAAFQAEAARRGLRLSEIANLDGYNYSRGRPVTLLLYRKAP